MSQSFIKWRPNDFVCSADYYQEIVRQAQCDTKEESLRMIDNLTDCIQPTKTYVNNLLRKMIAQQKHYKVI